MKTRVLFILFGLFLMAAAVSAQEQSINCGNTPSWVTTAAPQSNMLPPGSSFTTTVYVTDFGGLTPTQTDLLICGYWTNADNQPLYYVVQPNNPQRVYWFNRASVPNG